MSTRKFNIRRLAEGVFEYVPVVFEEQHFCISLCTVHSSLLNFQFRTRPLRHQVRGKSQLSNFEDDHHHPHNVKDAEMPEKVEVGRTGVTEWLFADESGQIAQDVNLSEIEIIYNGYMQQLIGAYEQLKTKFNTYALKCLSERQKRECGMALTAPNLVLPSEKETK